MILIAPVEALADPGQTEHTGDQGDGTYRNPVLSADYSDPDVCRRGDDFYMVASTFESSPGVTVLHSKDLVNWETIGAAIPDIPQLGPSAGMADRQRAGLTHFNGGKSYATLDILQTAGVRSLEYDENGQIMPGPAIPAKTESLRLRSIVKFDEVNAYAYSFDGVNYTDFGGAYKLTSGNFRGDQSAFSPITVKAMRAS